MHATPALGATTAPPPTHKTRARWYQSPTEQITRRVKRLHTSLEHGDGGPWPDVLASGGSGMTWDGGSSGGGTQEAASRPLPDSYAAVNRLLKQLNFDRILRRRAR